MKPMDSLEHLIESINEQTSPSFDQQTINLMEEAMDHTMQPMIRYNACLRFVSQLPSQLIVEEGAMRVYRLVVGTPT